MTFNPFQELATGGLEDFDESERTEAEIRPLVEELMKKAEEINVPIHIVVGNSMYVEPGGVRTNVMHMCSGRMENGAPRLPITFKALSSVTQDINLVQNTVLKHLERQNPISAMLNDILGKLGNTDMSDVLKSLSNFNNPNPQLTDVEWFDKSPTKRVIAKALTLLDGKVLVDLAEETEDQRIIREAYDYQMDYDGFLCGLTAGDQGYEKTSIKCIPDSVVLVDRERLKEVLRLRYTCLIETPPNVNVEIDKDIAYLQGGE